LHATDGDEGELVSHRRLGLSPVAAVSMSLIRTGVPINVMRAGNGDEISGQVAKRSD